MPKYISDQPRATYTPFTFQELLTIPSMYKQDYEKSMEEYNKVADQAALIKSMSGDSPTAQKLLSEYDNGVKGLSEAMLSGRWNSQMASEAMNLRNMYREKIMPIGSAIQRQQEDIKRFDALNKDGKAFGTPTNLESYMNPDYRGKFYSGSMIQNEAMTAGSLAANGFTPKMVAEYWIDPGKEEYKGINSAVDKLRREYGYADADDATRAQIDQYINAGLGLGMQAAANKTYDEQQEYKRKLNLAYIAHNNRGGRGNSSTKTNNEDKQPFMVGNKTFYRGVETNYIYKNKTDKIPLADPRDMTKSLVYSEDINNILTVANAKIASNDTLDDLKKISKKYPNIVAVGNYNYREKGADQKHKFKFYKRGQEFDSRVAAIGSKSNFWEPDNVLMFRGYDNVNLNWPTDDKNVIKNIPASIIDITKHIDYSVDENGKPKYTAKDKLGKYMISYGNSIEGFWNSDDYQFVKVPWSTNDKEDRTTDTSFGDDWDDDERFDLLVVKK